MNRKMSRKAAAAILAVYSSAFLLPMYSGMCISASAASVMSTAEIAKDMGIGWNLGNTLDAHIQGYSSDNIYNYETQWGNPVVTQSLINEVKEKGFNTIRIPVTWYQHISSDGNYTIDSAWMARVKEVVNYAYNNGMYVILNIHHENWINRSDFATAGDAMETQLRAVWRQIADEFADYDQHLIFEGMNEPRAEGVKDLEWNGNEECYNVVNQLNAAFVETVRSDDAANNKTRMLMIPDYAASCSSYIYSSLTIPKSDNSIDADNDGDDDYVAVSIHAYSPYNFTMADEGDHSSFSSSYAAELDGIFSAMQAKFLQEGVQIVLGEFSASNYGYDSARVAWAEAYMRNATEYGIPCVLWDNNKESNNGGEAHGYINRTTEEWYDSGGLVIDQLFSTRNSTAWGTKTHITYPMYDHNDYSTGSSVTIDEGSGNMFVSDIGGFKSGTELAIKYSGTTLPLVALMNSGWGGWTTLDPYDYDKDNKIAYFSYDQIMNTWNAANGALGVIQIKNIGSIGYGGITLLTIPEQKPEAEKYAVTFDSNDVTVKNNGNTVLSGTQIEKGTELTVTAVEKTGYTAAVKVNGELLSGTTLTVNGAVTITVEYTAAEVGKPVFTAAAGDKKVTLSWNAVSGATKYRVFYRANGVTSWNYVETTSTSRTISGLTNGKKYDFLVIAYNGSKWSKWSNADVINATPVSSAPALPAFKASAGDKKVTLSWNAVSGATKYRVFYRANGAAAWNYVETTAVSRTISGLTNGRKYDFLVLATNGSSWSSWTNANIINATPVSSAPALPAFKATVGDKKVTLSWNAVSGATKYRVFYRANGAAAWNYVETTATSRTISGITNGKKYDFLVLANDGTNWSKWTTADIINETPNA